MSKTLLDRFLTRAVKRGRLGVVFADGSARTYGSPASGVPGIVMGLVTLLRANEPCKRAGIVAAQARCADPVLLRKR
jgi:hypothetical protein